MKTDVLFIHPGNHESTYQDLSKEYTAIATPAWTALIADFTRRGGYTTAIYDVNVAGWDTGTAEEIITRYAPALVVMMVYGHNPSASTQTMPAARRIARDIKAVNKDVPIAFGGTHPSALPEKTLREEAIDFVIRGEGPHTVSGLIDALKGRSAIERVPGLSYKRSLDIFSNPPAAVIEDLDGELPNYAWDLLPELSQYRAHNMHCFQDFEKSQTADFSDIRTPYVAMNTSLGCPYSCHYCCINAIFGKPRIRYWSLEKVADWMGELTQKYNVRNIRFEDELFILSPERVERFCDILIERKYGLNIWAYGRVDTIRPALLSKMKKAGINWICLGIEAGNARVRGNVNKNIHKDITETVRALQANDIYVLGNYMFGLPEDDLATMQETLDLAVDLNCEFANFYSVMAYPGSKLYQDALAHPEDLPAMWGGFSQHGVETRPLPTRHITANKVLRFRDNAFDQYFKNPRYLNMVEKKFGAKVRAHLENMLLIKVKRRLLET